MSEGLTPQHRLLSDSEIGRAMTCQAQWDFAYGGHLVGDALKKKAVAPILSGGKAWGAAVAAYHATIGDDADYAGSAAVVALDAALDADAERQKKFGLYDQQAHDELRMKLLGMFSHYVTISDPWVAEPITEHELLVPIPSRSGKGLSNRYKLLAYLDATRKIDGRLWLVEFKLRGQLTSVEFIQLMRQIRRYAWAWWQHTGIKPAGVEVHERLNEVPKSPRMVLAPGQKSKNKDGSPNLDAKKVPSHAKDQLCTAEAYKLVCAEHDVEPSDETVAALEARKWQQVVPIMFRDGELEEAGRELVSAAQVIRDLDNGVLFPVRNSKPQNCRGCAFREICPSPDDFLVDALFERVPAKRNRHEENDGPATDDE